jgi:hypothetical protein
MALNQLFNAALQDPDAADFAALRQAYAESPEHDHSKSSNTRTLA